jgi:YD repeat-containing protein
MPEPFSRRSLLGVLLAFLAGLLGWRRPAPAMASASATAGNRMDVLRADPHSCTITTCTYDAHNRLTSITDGLGTITTVIYDTPGWESDITP